MANKYPKPLAEMDRVQLQNQIHSLRGRVRELTKQVEELTPVKNQDSVYVESEVVAVFSTGPRVSDSFTVLYQEEKLTIRHSWHTIAILPNAANSVHIIPYKYKEI